MIAFLIVETVYLSGTKFVMQVNLTAARKDVMELKKVTHAREVQRQNLLSVFILREEIWVTFRDFASL